MVQLYANNDLNVTFNQYIRTKNILHVPVQYRLNMSAIDYIKKKYGNVVLRAGRYYIGNKEVVTKENAPAVILNFFKDPETGFSGTQKIYKNLKNYYVGISRPMVETVIGNNSTAQIHRPWQKEKEIKPRRVKKPYFWLQCDISFYRDKTFNLLTVIDLFTKKAWVAVLADIKSTTVARAFTIILNQMLKYPEIVQTDQGSEFEGPFLSVLNNAGINHIFFLSHSPQTQGAIEKFNRTLKAKMAMYETENNASLNAVTIRQIVPKLVKSYNNSYHSTIKTSPNEAELSWQTNDVPKLNAVKTAQKLINDQIIGHNKARFRELKVGDVVRILIVSEVKKPYINKAANIPEDPKKTDKRYAKQWSKDLFVIVKKGRPKNRHLSSIEYYRIRKRRGRILLPKKYLRYELQLVDVNALNGAENRVKGWNPDDSDNSSTSEDTDDVDDSE